MTTSPRRLTFGCFLPALRLLLPEFSVLKRRCAPNFRILLLRKRNCIACRGVWSTCRSPCPNGDSHFPPPRCAMWRAHARVEPAPRDWCVRVSSDDHISCIYAVILWKWVATTAERANAPWIRRAGFDSRLCPLGWIFPHCPRGKVLSHAMNTAAHVTVRTPVKRPHPSGWCAKKIWAVVLWKC